MKTILVLLASLLIINFGKAQDVDFEIFSQGFTNPVEIAHAGDSRLFVVQQAGQIRILNADGTINATPFLDISSIVKSGGEQGLLGLAFDPDYANNGRFFVNYINTLGNTIVARYEVSNDSNIALTTGEILLNIEQPYSNHNGGCIKFGPDGYLWISVGDGGSGGDPDDYGQDTSALLGKMLRIDVSGSTYDIPNDNPFVGIAGRDEIWSYGLRNAWKFSFDKTTGDVWIADVGQSAFEEINHINSDSAGINYGWRCYEGNAVFNTTGCGDSTNMVYPVAVYPQVGARKSLTGGYVYRGSLYPNFQGKYFFADFVSSEVGWVDNNNLSFLTTVAGSNISTFGEDINGELYIAGFNGNIYKLIAKTISTKEIIQPKFSIYPNPSNGLINIEHNATIDAIDLFSIDGRLIQKFDNKSTTIDVSSLDKGIYLLTITSGNTISTNKIFVP